MGNIPAFICANTIMAPEFLTIKSLKKQWANPSKVLHYPGFKEDIYLLELDQRLHGHATFARPAKKSTFVYFRPEPWTVQYYRGSPDFMAELLIGIKDDVDAVLLPRRCSPHGSPLRRSIPAWKRSRHKPCAARPSPVAQNRRLLGK